MALIKVAMVSEIPEGRTKKVELSGSTILLTNVGGMFYALSNKCPHMGGSLADGNLEGKYIVCPKHGAKFDVTTGENAGNAKIAFLKVPVKDVTTYEVKVVGEDIFVDI